MANLGTLTLDLVAKIGGFTGPLDKAGRESKKHMNTIQQSAESAGVAIGGMLSVGAVTAFTKSLINTSLEMQKLDQLFSAAAGSVAVANKELAYMRDLSNKLGLSFQAAAPAYGKFLAATRNTAIEGESARKVFEGVSEAATALGLSADESSGIFLALSQMMSKGKVSAEELTGQLGERLPGALKLAADAMGLTTAELMKQMELGKVMSADLLPKLAEQLHKTYGSAAEEAAKKGQAGINRFKNELLLTSSVIGDKLLPALDMATSSMADMLKSFREEPSGGWRNLLMWLPGTANMGQQMPVIGGGQLREAEAGMAAKEEQKKINAARAAAEKFAAGQTERDKKAAAALKAVNAGLKEQNTLLEESVKGWELSGLASGLLDNPLTLAAPRAPKFSLTGASETMGFGGNGTEGLALDPAAAAGMLKGMAQAPSFGGVDAAVGGPFAELNKIGEAEEKLAEWYNTQLEMLEEFRQERADLNATWDATEQDLDKRHQAELLRIEQARQSMQLQAASTIFGDLAGMTKAFAGEQSKAYRAMFAVSKAFAIADGLIQISNGIAKAANNPWPVNLAAMATVAAAGAGVISSIQSVAMVGMAHDGIDSVPKEGTWLLNKGERVTTSETSAKLDRTLDNVQKSQGGGAPVVNLYEDKSKAGTVNSRNQDGRNIIDIFVADLMGDGRTQKAMSRKFGMQPVGA